MRLIPRLKAKRQDGIVSAVEATQIPKDASVESVRSAIIISYPSVPYGNNDAIVRGLPFLRSRVKLNLTEYSVFRLQCRRFQYTN